ncbi:MAG: response regulator [bacterium]
MNTLNNAGKNILIIDDDPDYGEEIKAILEYAHYNAEVAYDADEGFEALEKGIFDLLILDMMIKHSPEGMRIARRIKEDSRLRHLPIIITTGMAAKAIHSYPEAIFADAVMEKPLEIDVLLKKVDDLLNSSL